MLSIATAAAMTVLVAGSAAKGYGESDLRPPPPTRPVSNVAVGNVAPLVRTVMLPNPLPRPGAALSGLSARIAQATDEAAAAGATIAVALLDRGSKRMFSNGNDQLVGIASVAKLFIADDALLQATRGKTPLSQQDRRALEIMLRASDDDAAENFWNRRGGDAIITEVASRYGLTSTTPGSDGRWWNAMSSVTDLIHYYDMLLTGSGGLSTTQADIIVGNLAQSTPIAIDGYPQRFGIPDGLYAEKVAVKQGWMCCIGSSWMHLSTGVIGPDSRYIMVIESLQPDNDTAARATITRAVKTMFPDGRI
jgi:hypothetical protein